MQNLEKLLEEVIFIIKEAGAKILTFYGGEYSIKDKGNDSPVTQADIASNEILIKGLEKYAYPILSEEGAPEKNIACPLSRLKADVVWIIDPLDGTKDFIDETGEFTIMVGLVAKQANGNYRPVLGVIYRPVSNTVYFAIKDQGAFVIRQEERIAKLLVSPETEWHNMIMLTSRNHTTKLEWQVAKELKISKVVTFGSSLKACLIADREGHVNFNPSKHTWEWDVCASDIIIHEAGGLFTDTKGDLFNYNKKDPRNNNGYLASSGVNHSDILNEINKIV